MIDILKEILIAFGGGATVVVLIIRFLSDKIADRVAQKKSTMIPGSRSYSIVTQNLLIHKAEEEN